MQANMVRLSEREGKLEDLDRKVNSFKVLRSKKMKFGFEFETWSGCGVKLKRTGKN